jgi:two-component system chemotaxis sensor kinase CheA
VKTVLVVEDEWAIADWLSAVLGDQGYSVLVANNGRQALELLRDHKPDLVITDFMMPVMDGPALLRAMKLDGVAHTPVIVMSSLPEATVAERCEGYRLFVRKPFREADLLRALEQVWSAPG